VAFCRAHFILGDAVNKILNDYESFIHNIDKTLKDLGIARNELAMMDHICYRVETQARYQVLLQELKTEATLLGEHTVSGRQIATFELDEYLFADGWTIPYLELPAPKQDSPYIEGLEHVELVVIGSLDRFLKRHSELHFALNGMNKTINPEATLKQANISVKFHEQQLGAVVGIENRLAQQVM
jgi:predicted metalloenzyme YecM